MRVLVLGGDGMLGHQLLRHLKSRHEVKVTLRQNLKDTNIGIFSRPKIHTPVWMPDSLTGCRRS